MAIALVALLGMRGSVAEAATPALTLDPETGLPAGTLVFRVEDHTCLLLPTREMECFCSCASEACTTRVEIVPLRPSATGTGTGTGAVPVTSTGPTLGGVPMWDPAPGWDPAPAWDPEPEPGQEPGPGGGNDRPRGNNGLGNGEDPAPPGIAKQGKPQNDDPAEPGNPQYRGKGSDGQPNGRGNKDN